MKKYINLLRAAVAGFVVLVFFCLSGTVHASSLGQWRNKVDATRLLAENDVPRAYQAALHLHTQLPLNATPVDQARALNLLARTEAYSGQNEAMLNHAQQALELAKQNGDKVGQAEAYLNMYLDLSDVGQNNTSDDAASRAMEALQGVNRPDLLGEAMLRLSMRYRRIGLIEASATVCLRAMDIALRSGDPQALLYARHGMAITYETNGRHAEAREQYREMSELARSQHLKQPEADAVLGMVDSDDLRAGEKLTRLALRLYRETGSRYSIAHGVYMLASIQFRQGQYGAALKTLNEVLDIYARYPSNAGMWWALNTRSVINQKLGRLNAAVADAKKADALAQSMGLLPYLNGSAQRMAEISAVSGDYAQAYTFSLKAGELAAKLAQEKNVTLLDDLVQHYQEESRERQIAELKQQREEEYERRQHMLIFLGFSFLLLAVSAYFLQRFRSSNRQLDISNLQLQQSESQILTLNASLEQQVQQKTEKLRQQALFLDRIIDSIADPIFVKDREHRWVLMNHAFCAMIGQTREILLGKSDYDFFPKDEADAFWAGDENMFTSGLLYLSENSITTSGGEIRYIHTIKNPFIADDGQEFLVGVIRDITERRRMENTLNASEEKHRTVFESANDGIFLHRIVERDGNTEFILHDLNQKGCELWGHSREDILSGNFDLFAMSNPPYSFEEATRRNRLAAAGEPQIFDWELKRGDGSKIWGEVNLRRIYIGGEAFLLAVMRDLNERKAMEQALFAREREFRTLAENAPDPIFRYDRDGCRIYVNAAGLRLSGKSLEELLGTRPSGLPLMSSAESTKLEQGIMQVLASGHLSEGEVLFIAPDGQEYVFYNHYVPEFGADGEIESVLSISMDITERKHLESELRQQAVFQQTLLNALNEVGMQLMLIEDGRINYVSNRELACEFGYSDADLEAGPMLAELIHPDDQARVMDMYQRRLAGETAPNSYELGLVTRNGERREYETSIAIVPDSVPLRVVSIGKDITSRKRMEADLRESRNFLRTIMNGIPDPIFVKDREHHWIDFNEAFCALVGHTRAEMLGKSDYDFMPREQADLFWKKDEAVFEFGAISINEEAITGEDGIEHFIQTKKTPIYPEGAEPLLVGVIRDITERKQMELARESALSEALRLGQLRTAFMAQMSHELRTPLNGILGYTQNMLLAGGLGEKQLSGLHIILHSGEHLLSLINGILDHAAIEAGKFELIPDDISLQEFFSTLIGIIRIRAEQKNIGFVCEVDASLLGTVRGDAQRLRQVLLNLLSNAVKFTDRGQVALRVGFKAPSRLHFEVQDTGIGIPQNQLGTIFLPFEQVSEVNRRAGGNGLGLAISRKLVQLMGGDLKVESRLGEGSTFWFEIEMEVVQSDVAAVNVAELSEQATTHIAQLSSQLIVPPIRELDILHGFALRGSMRDVVRHTKQLFEQDERYRPFGEQLQQLTRNFQTKALLNLIEQYREGQDKS